MSWQLVDAPSHIAPEVGANLLAGAGPWTAPLALDGEYVLTVEVLGGGVVEWSVAGVDGEGLPVTVPGLSETVPDGEWVRVTIPFTAPGFVGDAAVSLTVPGESRDPVLGELTGRTILTVPGDVLAETIMASGGIIAGTPGGARVELTEDGLIAYDSTDTETARINGEGGEFVGGSFRTSDILPGQVVLADDALSTNIGTTTGPGIRVVPEDATGFEYMPGIGPSTAGLMIYGGKRAGTGASIVQANPGGAFLRTFREGGAKAGEMQTSPTASYMRTYREDGTTGGEMQTSPTLSYMRTYREDGTTGGQVEVDAVSSRIRTYSGNSTESGWVQVRPQDVELAYVAPDNTYFSRIRADANEAYIFTRAGGANRYLSVDADGVWVKTNKSGSWKHYNLEETAQDSGWQSIAPDAGYTGSTSFAWRNKGGVIWYRGTVTATWTAGWNTIATLPAEVRPEYGYTVNEAGTAAGVLIRMQVDGRLELYAPTAGTSTHRLTSLSYPIG